MYITDRKNASGVQPLRFLFFYSIYLVRLFLDWFSVFRFRHPWGGDISGTCSRP